jgi:GAF domain-containing protein
VALVADFESDALRETLLALSQFFVGDSSIEETLGRVAEMAVKVLPHAELAGITMMGEAGPETSVFTDAESPEIDQAQYDAGEGPCLDAFRYQEAYRIDEMDDDRRWPAFAKACLERGVRSTLSVPLLISRDGGDGAFGAMNFYAHQPNAFSSADVEAAEMFARTGAVVLANAKAYWEAYMLSEGLAEAMKSRAVIEQAKGVLMSQSRITSDVAMDILRRASQRENRKLRDIAADIVTQTHR